MLRNQCTCTCTWDVGTCTCTRTWRLITRTCTCTWSLSTWYSSTSYSCPWSCLHQIWNFLSFAILSKSKAWDRQTDRQTVWSTWSGLFLLHILYLYHRIQFKIHWTFTLYDDVLCMRYFWYHSFIYLITWLELNIECTYLPVLWLDLF